VSKLIKKVGKVFKKVGKFVKKYWKVIVIAAAIYFTAGIALSAMPSTAAFASSMPGFGTAGIFSKAAVAIGFQGAAGSGIASTIAASQAAAITGAGVVTTGLGAAPTATTVAATAEGTAIAGTATTGALASTVPGTIAPVAQTGVLAKTGAAIKGMSGLEKIALASTIFQGAGGLLSDDPNKLDKKAHARRYGQSFGKGRDGQGPGWGGAASDAFAGRFGGEEGEQDPNEVTPFTAAPPPNQGTTPFSNMAQSEQDASRDKQAVGGGYKSRNYMPT